jgi:uncharacterized protein
VVWFVVAVRVGGFIMSDAESSTVTNGRKRIPENESIRVVSLVKKQVNAEQNGRLIYLTVSGSHLYGWPSEDSDIDWRGCFVTGVDNLLGLKSRRDVVENRSEDISLFELKKEANLALAGNCNVLEHIFAVPTYRTSESLDLQKLIGNTMSAPGIYNSYRGMATFNYKKFILQGKKTYKKYLYVFRGLMAGIYALETGRIQPNIAELNQYFKQKEVNTLLKRKIEGLEEAEVEDLKNNGVLEELTLTYFDRIDRAYQRTKLPHEADKLAVEALNSWVIKTRRAML